MVVQLPIEEDTEEYVPIVEFEEPIMDGTIYLLCILNSEE